MLKRLDTMPRTETRDLILLMGIWGNHLHYVIEPTSSEADVVRILNRIGWKMPHLIEHCRKFTESIPHFENLIGPSSQATGLTVSRIDPSTGQWKALNSGDGTINETEYWARFEISVEDFELAFSKQNPDRFLASVGAGLAAIEAFLNFQFLKRGNPPASAELREPLDWKVENWIPKLTGKKFNKGTKPWERFKRLRQLRNDDFQHPKVMWSGKNYSDLPELFNDYRWGICRLLLDLHMAFRMRCPSKIIRYSFHPKIYWEDSQS